MVIHGDCALSLRVKQPDEQDYLQYIVERYERKYDSPELIHEGQNPKDHPVCQPLLIIICLLRLQGVETHEARIYHADKVCNKGLPEAEQNQPRNHHENDLYDSLAW